MTKYFLFSYIITGFWCCSSFATGQLESHESWLQSHAASVADVDAPLTDDEIKILDQALFGKRVVFLGESAHWIHEKYGYRLRFLKYLMSKGFTNIGMEMGLSDGGRVNQFIKSGRSKDLDKVALYGYQGPAIVNRLKESKCALISNPHPEFKNLFRSEEENFYTQLRKIGVSLNQEIHHFGFDVDTIPGGGYEDLSSFLSPFASSDFIRSLLREISPQKGESTPDEIARLKRASLRIDAQEKRLEDIIGSSRLQEIKLSLFTLIESLKFESVFLSRPCNENDLENWNRELLDAMAQRERAMFRIFSEKLKLLGPDAKIVLMGHNFHVSKEPQNLWFTHSGVPDPHAPKMWPSIGEFVSKTLNLPTYSIWQIHNTGFQSNIDCKEMECPVETGPQYFGHLFSQAGPIFSLSFREKETPNIFNQRLDFAVNSGTYSGNVTKNADLIFFINEVSGLKP